MAGARVREEVCVPPPRRVRWVLGEDAEIFQETCRRDKSDLSPPRDPRESNTLLPVHAFAKHV